MRLELKRAYPLAIAQSVEESKAGYTSRYINSVVELQVLIAVEMPLVVLGGNNRNAVMGLFSISRDTRVKL